MMKLSVIIPIYNAADTLQKCLQSVSEQDNTDVELILIDDGSTDDSLRICQDYAAAHDNTTVLTQKHTGQAAARNLGIQHASGTYLFFADADDIVLPNAFQHIIERMDGTELLVFGYDQNGTKHTYPSGEASAAEIKKTYFCADKARQVKGSVWNKCFVREVIARKHVEFPALSRNEEEVFLMEYLDHIEHIRFDEQVLYAFHPITLQKAFVRMPDDYAQQVVSFKNTCLAFAEKWDVLTQDSKNAIAKEFFGKMMLALKLCADPKQRDKKRFYDNADLLLSEIPAEQPVRSVRMFRILRKKWYWLAYLLICRQVK